MKARLVALRGLGEWTADWFLARYLARPARVARGRPRAAQGGGALFMVARRRESARERFEPFENLTAHYLLLAQRVP